MSMSTIISVIFDFDDTLAPDSTTHLLEEYGLDPNQFWNVDFQERVQSGYDPTVAYLTLVLDNIGPDKELGDLTRDDLQECGANLEEHFYPGIPELFEDLDQIVAGYDDIEIEYYVITEGIESLILGSEIEDYCKEVYASRLATNDDDVFTGIKRPISFTDKTRYIYEINKGIGSSETMMNPFLVNKEIPREERRVPFENMIYIGDGITDIPCFSLVKDRDGRVFGVMNKEDGSAKQQALLELGSPRRAGNLNTPNYTESGQLGSLLRLTIEGICTNKTINQLEAL